MAKAERQTAICHGEENQCVCLSKSEKRKALLLCCVKVQTPCPVHSTITESGTAEARLTDDTAGQFLSLFQRLRNVLYALFKKTPVKEQHLDSLLLENENFTTDLKEFNQDVPIENKDVYGTARSDRVYYTEDDLLVTAQSMLSGNKRRPRNRRARRVSEQILAKYVNYDENRERIGF